MWYGNCIGLQHGCIQIEDTEATQTNLFGGRCCPTRSNLHYRFFMAGTYTSVPIAPSSGFGAIEDPYACLLFFRSGRSSNFAEDSELLLEGSYNASAAFPSSMFGPTPFFCSECDG